MQCENCGKEVKSQEEQHILWMEARKAGRYGSGGKYCDGVMSMAPDPFAEEIHGDFTEYWDCEGNRYESSMEI